MRVQRFARSFIGLVLLLAVSAPAAAQRGAGDVAVSYSVMRDQDIEEVFPLGWVAAATIRLNDWLGIVGEVSGNYKSIDAGGANLDLSVHAFLGGARISSPGNADVKPFGQILFGAGRAVGGFQGISASDTGFVIQPGAGLDYKLGNNLGVRLQGDYRAIRNEGETGSEFRFAGGLVFVF